MKNRTYFFWTRLKSGEGVNIVYNTVHKKGTENHILDFLESLRKNGLRLPEDSIERGKGWKNTFDNIFLLNEKNKEDECFYDYRVIDLR